MITINKDSLGDAIKEGLVVVEFRKEVGCPNCEQMKPVLERFEKENPQVKVCVFPCVDAKDVPEGYQFKMFPGIFSFKDGVPIRGYSGFKTPQQMSLIFTQANDLKIAQYDFQAQADFFKEEIKGYNQGVNAPQPTVAETIVNGGGVPNNTPLPDITDPAEDKECLSCQ